MYAKLFRKDVGVGMEILGDILQNSLCGAVSETLSYAIDATRLQE